MIGGKLVVAIRFPSQIDTDPYAHTSDIGHRFAMTRVEAKRGFAQKPLSQCGFPARAAVSVRGRPPPRFAFVVARDLGQVRIGEGFQPQRSDM